MLKSKNVYVETVERFKVKVSRFASREEIAEVVAELEMFRREWYGDDIQEGISLIVDTENPDFYVFVFDGAHAMSGTDFNSLTYPDAEYVDTVAVVDMLGGVDMVLKDFEL